MDDLFGQSDLDSGLKFSIVGALTRQYGTDQRTFLATLAAMLEGALPEETQVAHRGGLFTRKTVQKVTVSLSENRYGLEDLGRGPLKATRVHIVRGIALKTEEVSIPDWITELGAALEERAKTHEAARDALAQWLLP